MAAAVLALAGQLDIDGLTVGVTVVDGSGRAAERAAGLQAARIALSRASAIPEAVIGHGADGRPLWPKGFTGSISHGGSIAVAVVVPLSSGRIVGIDVEVAGALSPEDAATILGFDELPERSARQATRWWSAKEAAFKAWSHAGLIDGAVDPTNVHVVAASDGFTVTATSSLVERIGDVATYGAWSDVGDMVITLGAVLPTVC